MTEKLYDRDPYLFTFRATVRACEGEGHGYRILLDRTAFFPCEGGQGADHGLLGDLAVRDVLLLGGELWHLTDGALPVGDEVEGRVDAVRRLRHMRVHTGEHILSGVLHRRYGATNVGFHLGDTEVTLDLDLPLTAEELAAAEEAANLAVLEDRPVRILWPSAAELPTLDYRAKLDLTEGVRLVEIEGVDLCACCAPHVLHTGECGLIKIVSHMSYKGGVRLHIAVGTDALADYREKQENVHAISVLLSLPEGQVADGVARTLAALAEERRRLSSLRTVLRAERVAALPKGEDAVLLYPDLDAGARRPYAEEAAAHTGATVLVLLPTEGGCRYAIGSGREEARARSEALHAALGGRGGGHAALSQGSLPADAATVSRCFREGC